ncbi:MAG TPA: hypothetical protein PKM31_07235, partial [Bacillota bacterium]|nr:hypothetical protein [Bacillota bacterium]
MERQAAAAAVTAPDLSGSSPAMSIFIPSTVGTRSSDNLDDARAILQRHGGEAAVVFLHPEWFEQSFRSLALPEGAMLAVHDMSGKNLMRYTKDGGEGAILDSSDQAESNQDVLNAVRSSRHVVGSITSSGGDGVQRLVSYGKVGNMGDDP